LKGVEVNADVEGREVDAGVGVDFCDGGGEGGFAFCVFEDTGRVVDLPHRHCGGIDGLG
jgi:hypothetical protein